MHRQVNKEAAGMKYALASLRSINQSIRTICSPFPVLSPSSIKKKLAALNASLPYQKCALLQLEMCFSMKNSKGNGCINESNEANGCKLLKSVGP